MTPSGKKSEKNFFTNVNGTFTLEVLCVYAQSSLCTKSVCEWRKLCEKQSLTEGGCYVLDCRAGKPRSGICCHKA